MTLWFDWIGNAATECFFNSFKYYLIECFMKLSNKNFKSIILSNVSEIFKNSQKQKKGSWRTNVLRTKRIDGQPKFINYLADGQTFFLLLFSVLLLFFV